MKKFLSIVLALTLGITALSAQEYKNAIGLRIGYDVSVTYKTFVSQSNFVDVGINLTPWGGDFGATLYGFYDWNFSIGQSTDKLVLNTNSRMPLSPCHLTMHQVLVLYLVKRLSDSVMQDSSVDLV